VPKTYVVKVSGVPSEEAIEELRGGFLFDRMMRSRPQSAYRSSKDRAD